jgi:hypothetical protein
MLKVKRAGAADKAPVTFELGHGAVMIARVLDAFEHKVAMAEARAELNAIVAGDTPRRAWPTLEPRFAEIRASQAAQASALAWMHAVLLATACATALEGVVDEDGAPLPASFETFELLFNDEGVEGAFRLGAYKIGQIWDAEKNVSGPGPNGSGPEDVNIAQPAAPLASHALTVDSETTADAALTSSTPPEPPKASSPGTSPAAPDAGTLPG